MTTPTPPSHSEAPRADKAPAQTESRSVERSLAGSTWVALILGALLLIALLVFIAQNQEKITIEFFAWQFEIAVGIGLLVSAIAGALIMALVGGVRMMQLRRQITKG